MRALRGMLLLGLLALMAVVPAGASNTVTFQDSTGEPGVKDITTVVISNDDKGLVTIRLNVPSLPTYTVDVDVDIFIDTDNNAATGLDRHPGRRLRHPAVPRRDQPLQVGRHRLHAALRRPARNDAHLQLGERREHQDQRHGARQHEEAADPLRGDRRDRLRPGDGRARLRACRRLTSRRTSAEASTRTT